MAVHQNILTIFTQPYNDIPLNKKFLVVGKNQFDIFSNVLRDIVVVLYISFESSQSD
jgi:hypothetical protein